MSTTVKLKVLSRQRGIASQKSSFTVEYNGKEYKIPMFGFQEDEPTPETIECEIDEKGKITQNVQVLYDKLYPELGKAYLFKVKRRWPSLKHYEIIDPRIEKEDRRHKLLFTQSAPDLELGQMIMCTVKNIKNSQLVLQLKDKSPSFIVFHDIESIFHLTENIRIKDWLDGLFGKGYMSEIKKMYDIKDGRWILLFARYIEDFTYNALTKKDGISAILPDFCRSWLNMIEHSSFIADMSKDEQKTYGKDLETSIEVCEDFLDAINVPDTETKVKEYIASLDPRYYPFRIERRFRFLSCAFSTDFPLLEANIQPLLEKLKDMGEKVCSSGSIAKALTYILKVYSDRITAQMESSLSYDSKDSQTIKKCALSLCYLTRIMYRCGDGGVALYTSRLYQLLSLSDNYPQEEKLKLLKNSYHALFINKSPLGDHRWETFEEMVFDRAYIFSQEVVPHDSSIQLAFTNGDTKVELTNDGFTIAPINTPTSELTTLALPCGLSINLCYGKSLSKISQHTDFANVQSTWNLVEKSVFAPAKTIQKKENRNLIDGDEVDIYVTDIINEYKAMCRTVDYDVEGEILFGDLFFYHRPLVNRGTFRGSDGTPLLFPVIYHNDDGKVTFTTQDFKLDFVQDTMPRGIVTCCVISKRDSLCVGISQEGFFFNFYSHDEKVAPICFVDVAVDKIRPSGHADATFYGFSTEKFDNGKAYVNYLRAYNKYCYEGEETLAMAKAAANEKEYEVRESGMKTIKERHIRTLANIVLKTSRVEKELRDRYGYIYVCKMLSQLAHHEKEISLCSVRMRYTKTLFDFATNNRLIDSVVEQFMGEHADGEQPNEVVQMENIVKILGRYEKPSMTNTLDKTLMDFLVEGATPLEVELARLVLSGNMLTNFNNRAIADQLLEEIGHKLNINIIKREPISIGLEEGQTVEFKTSIVYPPTGDGREDIDLQSENIARVISSMMNTDGGTLYIGVNDNGHVVGLQGDLDYFSNSGALEEVKARDKFRNHFSHFLTTKFGALNAAKLTYDFEEIQGYYIFKVTIPQLPNAGGDYVRVGTTVQRKN